jgi:hypothetical protein
MKVAFTLSPEQVARAEKAAENCLRFEQSAEYPLGVALIEHHFGNGSAEAVVDALAAFQNRDGGFGKDLEVDIKSPVSNPFAARLAMDFLLGLRERPRHPLIDQLGDWLNANQSADGDWHFAPEVYEAELAPWFAAWTFPSLNPACCLAGLGNALGLLTRETLDRTARLYDEKASIEEARAGEFYNLLPYIDYFSSIDHPERDAYLDAIAENISTTAANGKYDDASHFLDQALGGGPDLVARIDPATLATYADRLLDEQSDDGGWPNPYSEPWRPLASANAIVHFAKLRNGV